MHLQVNPWGKKRKEWEKEKELFQEKRFGLGELTVTGLSCDPISCHIIHKQEIPSDHLCRSRNHAWSFCVSSTHRCFLQGGSHPIEEYCWYWLLSQQIRRTCEEKRRQTKAQWWTYKNSQIIRQMTMYKCSIVKVCSKTEISIAQCAYPHLWPILWIAHTTYSAKR